MPTPDPTPRKGDWLQTYTGKQFWICDPTPDDIDIQDIAHSLSLLCRFNGHCESFYSVAQHSIHVSYIYGKLVHNDPNLVDNPKGYLAALLHDAPEAYIGDIIRPLKVSLGQQIKYIEEEIWRSVLLHFELNDIWPEVRGIVKRADEIMLATEKRDLVREGVGTWKINAPPDENLRVVPQANAKPWFLQAFRALQESATVAGD